MSNVAATRKDIDDVLGVLDQMMTRIDERFSALEQKADKTELDIQKIFSQLDGIEKRLEISEDERIVMAHQLTRLHSWVEKAAERIDIKFAH